MMNMADLLVTVAVVGLLFTAVTTVMGVIIWWLNR